MLTKKPFGDIITFTRASSGGRFNAQGVYEMVPANTPRIDYDPVTGECRGLLIEEQRTNLWAQGNTAGGHGGCTRTSTGVPSSYSPHTWQRATITTGTGGHHIEFYIGALTVGTTYTFSLDIRRGNFDTIALWNSVNGIPTTIDLSSGAAGTPANCTVLPLGNGAYRFSWWVTAMATSQGFRVYFNAGGGSWTGNGTDYFDYANPQLEVGSFPTSYIPTSGSQVTRAADVASINTLSPWFNASEGCFYVDVSSEWGNDNRDHQILRIVGGAHGVQGIARFSGGSLQIHDGTSYRALPNSLFNTPGSRKVAVSYRNGETASPAAINGIGGNYTSDGSVFDAATAIGLGRTASGSNVWGGHIRKLRYFPKRLDNATLQALTA